MKSRPIAGMGRQLYVDDARLERQRLNAHRRSSSRLRLCARAGQCNSTRGELRLIARRKLVTSSGAIPSLLLSASRRAVKLSRILLHERRLTMRLSHGKISSNRHPDASVSIDTLRNKVPNADITLSAGTLQTQPQLSTTRRSCAKRCFQLGPLRGPLVLDYQHSPTYRSVQLIKLKL